MLEMPMALVSLAGRDGHIDMVTWWQGRVRVGVGVGAGNVGPSPAGRGFQEGYCFSAKDGRLRKQ